MYRGNRVVLVDRPTLRNWAVNLRITYDVESHLQRDHFVLGDKIPVER